MARENGAQMYARLARLVARMEKDPKADPDILAKARKAMADYEALPRRLRVHV